MASGLPRPAPRSARAHVLALGLRSQDADGRLIVHEDVASRVLGVFRQLYVERFSLRKVVPVDAYGASDFRSMERL